MTTIFSAFSDFLQNQNRTIFKVITSDFVVYLKTVLGISWSNCDEMMACRQSKIRDCRDRTVDNVSNIYICQYLVKVVSKEVLERPEKKIF